MSTIRSLAIGAALAAASFAQHPTFPVQKDGSTSSGPASPAVDVFADGAIFDALDDTTLWVAARGYKARFRDGEAWFLPFLGSLAPRNHPFALRVARVTVAGEPLALRDGATPRRDGDAVRFALGALELRYDARKNGLEQSFVFASLPARGELRIELAVVTGLLPQDHGASLRFLGPDGGVDYGPAVAIDATGASIPVARVFDDGCIALSVPADFVANAKLPLVVDPLLSPTTTVASTSTHVLRDPDLVFDESTQRTMVCFELVYSAVDSDVYAYEMDASGNPIAGSGLAIDASTTSWQRPRIANNALARRNLVVAQVSPNNASPFTIWGRTRDAGSWAQGNPVLIEDQSVELGDKLVPDVGGDPHLFPPTYFTVVWERVYSAADHDIHAVQLTNDANPARTGGTVLLDNAGTWEGQPQISTGAGAPLPDASFQHWLIVWKRALATTSEIRGRSMRWEGSLSSNFLVSSGDTMQDSPSASTITVPGPTGQQLWLVAWEQGYLTDSGDTHDVMVALVARPGVVVSPVLNLQVLEGNPVARTWNQFQPRVASDGCRFVVAYGEDLANSGDLDVRVTTLHALPTTPTTWTLGLTEVRVAAAYLSTVESMHAIAAAFESNGGPSGGPVARNVRYALAWHEAGSGGTQLVRHRLYDGMTTFGGFGLLPTACGSPTISYSGTPALAMTIRVDTSGGVLLVGMPRWPTLPICGTCELGIDVFDSLAAQTQIVVPSDPALLGGTIGFQGVSVAVGEPCLDNLIGLSDTLLVTVR
ncbi:MAG: hypothetical protein HZB39_10705 [Planctomycetes bacterium]|nr:hypothetical protein [Planctomycetota bacterium]